MHERATTALIISRHKDWRERRRRVSEVRANIRSPGKTVMAIEMRLLCLLRSNHHSKWNETSTSYESSCWGVRWDYDDDDDGDDTESHLIEHEEIYYAHIMNTSLAPLYQPQTQFDIQSTHSVGGKCCYFMFAVTFRMRVKLFLCPSYSSSCCSPQLNSLLHMPLKRQAIYYVSN